MEAVTHMGDFEQMLVCAHLLEEREQKGTIDNKLGKRSREPSLDMDLMAPVQGVQQRLQR